MYLEILHEVVQEYLSNEKDKKLPIKIELTSFIYDTLEHEINEYCKIGTEVPIERFEFSCLYLYGRSISLIKADKLNPIFERKIVERLAQLRIFEYRQQNAVKNAELNALEQAE